MTKFWFRPAVKATLLILSVTGKLSQAETDAHGEPVWEAGIAAAALSYPHYLGADQQSAYLIPLPYFVYRGEYIQADRGGLRGFLYNSDRLDLRLSLRGSLPVNSTDNDARAGMDDLDLLLEAGPVLQVKIFEDASQLLRLDLPVRAAFSLGNSFLRHEGWTSNPRLYHEAYIGPWTVTSNAGVVFSDRRYHGYIYDVDYNDVTADRPYYQSRSGYTAARFSVGARRRVGDYFVGAQLSYYNLNGAENEDSPLLKQNDYLAASLFFAWVLGESRDRVPGHGDSE